MDWRALKIRPVSSSSADGFPISSRFLRVSPSVAYTKMHRYLRGFGFTQGSRRERKETQTSPVLPHSILIHNPRRGKKLAECLSMSESEESLPPGGHSRNDIHKTGAEEYTIYARTVR